MGRKRNDHIRKYFTYNAGTKTQVCSISNCSKPILRDNLFNLRRHIQSAHRNIYEQYQASMLEEKSRCIVKDKVTIKIQVNQEEYKRSCVHLICKGAIPYNTMNLQCFRNIVNPVASALNITINAENIKNEVSLVAAELRLGIKNNLENKLFSLKLDEVTRLNRSFLGINLQYIANGKITIKTIEMFELKDRHTAEYIKEIIIKSLNTYDLDIAQIYSITTDNGRNMLKATNLINNELSNLDNSDDEESDNDESDEPEADITQQTGTHVRSGITLLANSARTMNNLVNTIKCAAHTLQLAVNDVLNENVIRENLTKLRILATKLRTPIHRNLLEQNNLKKPLINNITRWNSSFYMIKRLLELKNYCETYKLVYKELNLDEEVWIFASNFIKVFTPVEQVTLKLQAVQLPLGDFYKVWLELKFSMTLLCTEYTTAKAIMTQIGIREKNLLENQVIVAGLYLDPRFNCILSIDHRQSAISHLKVVYNHLIAIESRSHTAATCSLSTTMDATENSISSPSTSVVHCSSSSLQLTSLRCEATSTSTDLNKLLNEFLAAASNVVVTNDEPHAIAVAEIQNYKPMRIDVSVNILHYWETKKEEFPNLFKLAQIIHAVPATQASVERCFSSLKLILSDQRNRLASESISDLMMVRLNDV